MWHQYTKMVSNAIKHRIMIIQLDTQYRNICVVLYLMLVVSQECIVRSFIRSFGLVRHTHTRKNEEGCGHVR